MKQETIKIQVLNDTKLCVLPVLPDMKTIVPVESISGLTVSWGIRGHETEPVATTIENGYIVLPISASMPLGVYSVHMQGTIDGEQWSDNRAEMFELTKYGEGIRYDRYYTKTVVVGLPDSYVQELREELEQKIKEAEEAKAYWQQQALNLDGVAKEEGGYLESVADRMGDTFDTPEDNTLFGLFALVNNKLQNLWDYLLETITGKINELAKKSDLPNDYAREGSVAKTLDDIKVEIPEDLTRQADLTRATETISGKIGPLDATKVIAIAIDDSGELFRLGERVRKYGQVYYQWISSVEDFSIYTMMDSPTVGAKYYIDEGGQMQEYDSVTAIYTESLVGKLDELKKAIEQGGGGITPEQWEQIAKEQTLNDIKGMLTLADGEVTAELQTLIPNEEETV